MNEGRPGGRSILLRLQEQLFLFRIILEPQLIEPLSLVGLGFDAHPCLVFGQRVGCIACGMGAPPSADDLSSCRQNG